MLLRRDADDFLVQAREIGEFLDADALTDLPDRHVRRREQALRLVDPVFDEEPLRRFARRFGELLREIRPFETDVIGDVLDRDRALVMRFDEAKRFADIIRRFRSCGELRSRRQMGRLHDGENIVQGAVDLGCGQIAARISFQRVQHRADITGDVGALADESHRFVHRDAGPLQHFLRPSSAEAEPAERPRIVGIRLVIGELAREDREDFALLDRMPDPSAFEEPAALDDVMNQAVIPNCRAAGKMLNDLLDPAIIQIQIGNQRWYMELFSPHNNRLLVRLYQTNHIRVTNTHSNS